jgi:zinc protease
MQMFQNKVLFIFLTLFTLISCTSTNKSSMNGEDAIGEGLNLNVKKFELDNGLRLLVLENHKLPIYSYYTFFDVGGRYEEKGTTGATHFLEHMMFKGAKKYGPGIFDSTIEANGGSTNAYTTFDSTVYYENVPSHTLEMMIDMEADRMQHVLLEPKAFEKERQVVLEERKFRYENKPNGQLFLAMMQNVFENTPYGGSVIGDKEDVEGLKRDQMMSFFKKFYKPNNAVIVIVGDVDADKTYKMINDKFGKIPRSHGLDEFKKKMDTESRYAHRGRYGRSVNLYGESPTPLFMMAFKGEKLGTHRSFVMDMLSSILGDGESAYLHQKYVMSKKPKLASISVGNYTLKNNGVFFISGELLKGVNLNKFKYRLSKHLMKACDKAITERTLQKTKNQYMVGMFQGVQTNAGIASFIGMRENFYGDYNFYKKEIDIYNNISEEEVRKACRSVFKGNESIFVSVWNKHSKPRKK